MLRSVWMATVVASLCIWSGAVSAAPFCKTLKGAGVAVGEESSRNDAEERLNKEIANWAERYNVPANAKNRKISCKVYLELLNEFECNAEATVCRDIPGKKSTKAPAKAAPAKKIDAGKSSS